MRGEASKGSHAELVGDDEDLDLADEGDKHVGSRNRMCKVYIQYKIKLSKGVPGLHSFRGNLSSVLPLAGEDVPFNYYLVEGLSQDHLTQGLQNSSDIKTLRGNFNHSNRIQF